MSEKKKSDFEQVAEFTASEFEDTGDFATGLSYTGSKPNGYHGELPQVTLSESVFTDKVNDALKAAGIDKDKANELAKINFHSVRDGAGYGVSIFISKNDVDGLEKSITLLGGIGKDVYVNAKKGDDSGKIRFPLEAIGLSSPEAQGEEKPWVLMNKREGENGAFLSANVTVLRPEAKQENAPEAKQAEAESDAPEAKQDPFAKSKP